MQHLDGTMPCQRHTGRSTPHASRSVLELNRDAPAYICAVRILRVLQGVSYWVIEDPVEIAELINNNVTREWETDIAGTEDHDGRAWLDSLPERSWRLERVRLTRVRLDQGTMNYSDGRTGYSFVERLVERRRLLQRSLREFGIVIWPLVLRAEDRMLMDGYCRYHTLTDMKVKETFAYVGYPMGERFNRLSSRKPASRRNIEEYYRKHDDFRRYAMSNERRVKQLSRLYDSNRRYFGKRVLDIACGGGVLGFLVEKHDRSYVGVDVNRDMIGMARAHAEMAGSSNRFLLADATREVVGGSFDTVTLLGNALCHFDTKDFARLVGNVDPSVGRGAHFIIDYRDVVDLLYRRKWKSKLVERNKGMVTVSNTTNCDTKKGNLAGVSKWGDGTNRVEFTQAIWAPFIVELVMESRGWKLIKREEHSDWPGWLDIYRKS